MVPEISIIVPVYNSEKFLAKCIESLINQKFTDIEIILINDGSKDTSQDICMFYAKKDSRIKVINQQNSGVSSARNNGINQSVGKYIMFCDSDDIVSPYWCTIMHNAILRNPYSLNVSKVTFNISNLFDKNYFANENYAIIDYFLLYKSGLSGYTPNKIYDLSIIKNNHIFFDKSYSIGEDVKFNIEYYGQCKNIVLIDAELYYYNTVEDSLTHKYKQNAFEVHLMPFYIRIKNIENKYISEYCDIWLYQFIKLFDNIFDIRNIHMSLLNKFAYNNKMIKTKEFQFCVENSSENKLLKSIFKLKNYYIFWIFQKLTSFKQKLRSNKNENHRNDTCKK